MLADDVGMNAFGVYAEMLAEQVTEAGGVKDRARPYDTLRRQARELPARVREHIDRIGSNEQNALRVVFNNFRNDIPPDLGVLHGWREPGLSRLGVGSRSQHSNGSTGTIGEISRPYVCRMGEWDGVVEVHRLTFGLSAVHIDQHDLSSPTTQQQSVGEGRTDIAGAHDSDTGGRRILLFLLIRHFRLLATIHLPISFALIAKMQEPVARVMPLATTRTDQVAAQLAAVLVVLIWNCKCSAATAGNK